MHGHPDPVLIMKSLRTPAHKTLIELLIAARQKAGLTQQQLASQLGRPQSYVAKYEGGERRLDVVEFIELTRALDLEAGRAVREVAARYDA